MIVRHTIFCHGHCNFKLNQPRGRGSKYLFSIIIGLVFIDEVCTKCTIYMTAIKNTVIIRYFFLQTTVRFKKHKQNQKKWRYLNISKFLYILFCPLTSGLLKFLWPAKMKYYVGLFHLFWFKIRHLNSIYIRSTLRSWLH